MEQNLVNKSDLVEIVRKSVNPSPDSLFMYTDPTYIYEDEWEEEMKGADTFEVAIIEYLKCSDFDGKTEFTHEDCEHLVFLMSTTHVRKNQKYGEY